MKTAKASSPTSSFRKKSSKLPLLRQNLVKKSARKGDISRYKLRKKGGFGALSARRKSYSLTVDDEVDDEQLRKLKKLKKEGYNRQFLSKSVEKPLNLVLEKTPENKRLVRQLQYKNLGGRLSSIFDNRKF